MTLITHWKFSKYDHTMFVPRRVHSGKNIYQILGDYMFDGRNVEFNGHEGLIKKKGSKITLPIEDVTWFEYNGDGIKTMRSGLNELRNHLYKRWFASYGDNMNIDGYIGWSEFYKKEKEKIFKVEDVKKETDI